MFEVFPEYWALYANDPTLRLAQGRLSRAKTAREMGHPPCEDSEMSSHDAKYWIDRLQLEPHPEGGYFRQTYKSKLIIERSGLPPYFDGARAASTAIYFLLEGKNFSAFHRLHSDEMWHFYSGCPVAVHVISLEGKYSKILLGNNPDEGEVFQAVVPAGCWFASHVADWKSWALVGCTVAPGFEFADFEMGKREELVVKYPQQRDVVERLTRE